ncbi:MAG TPA: hypothetical protein VGW38_25710 [Chloroflexota bacterium]|nr:hypothetical protein [Chloroflexota bacterium]
MQSEQARTLVEMLVLGLLTIGVFMVLLGFIMHVGGPSRAVQIIAGSFSPNRSADYSSRVDYKIAPLRSNP